jgi:hypothetical protein
MDSPAGVRDCIFNYSDVLLDFSNVYEGHSSNDSTISQASPNLSNS